jgi:hypothetical protein
MNFKILRLLHKGILLTGVFKRKKIVLLTRRFREQNNIYI